MTARGRQLIDVIKPAWDLVYQLILFKTIFLYFFLGRSRLISAENSEKWCCDRRWFLLDTTSLNICLLGMLKVLIGG